MDIAIAVYGAIVFFSELFIDLIMATDPDVPGSWGRIFTPSWFRRHTYMNEFGCWATTIIAFICMLVGGIYRVIYWLFHI